MGESREPTQHLLEEARRGNSSARDQLLERYRERLKRLVALRLDDRVAARLDASDIVQEALATAARRFEDYLLHPPMPFLDWLKRLARDRVIEAHRTHIMAERRSVIRENSTQSPDSVTTHHDPRQVRHSQETRRIDSLLELQDALNLLRPSDRQIIVMRHFENQTPAAIAEHFGITEGAAKVRTVRALLRLREILSDR